MRIFQTLRQSILNPLVDFIYPPVCFTCDHLLREGEEKVCDKCWKTFRRIHSDDPTWREIKSKFAAEGVVQDFISCFLFEKEGKLQDVIHLLKYQGKGSLGIRLGREIGKRILQSYFSKEADFFISVPLHKLKKRERGYNQSDFLCQGIAEVLRIPIASKFLVRKKYTVSQTELTLEQRRVNVDDAFMADPNFLGSIEGKSFILVDDIITTGSTINACARELHAHRASRVFAASVALAK